MSIDRFLNTMRAQASMNLNDAAHPRFGIITSYNQYTHTVKVKIQPEDPENPNACLSGDIPFVSLWVGNEWGLVCAPSVGDKVIVLFIEGYSSNGVAIGGIWNAANVPPAAPSGEFWLVHKSGSSLKFTNDGNVSLHAATNVNITAATNVNLSNTAMTNLKTLINSDLIALFNNHKHVIGDDLTGPPSAPLPSSVVTTTTKAN